MHEYKSNRMFRILTNVSIIDSIGSGLYSIVFLIYAATLPFKTLAVSIASVAWIVPALLNMVTGYLADHTHHKLPSMYRAYLVQTLLFLTIAFMIGRSSSMWVFFLIMGLDVIARLLGDYGSSLTAPLTKHIVSSENMNDATSISFALGSMISIIASALGASLIVMLHHQYDLFAILNAATFLIACVMLFANRNLYAGAERDINKAVVTAKENRGSAVKDNFATSFKLTMTEFKQNKFLMFMLTAGVLVNTLGTAFEPLTNLIFLHFHAILFINYGYTIAAVDIASSLGMIAGAILINDFLKNTSMVSLLSFTMGILALSVLDLLTLKSFWVFIALTFVSSYLLGKVNPRFSALLINTIPDDHIAASSGVLQTVIMIGAPIGQFIFLTLANAISTSTSLIVFGISCVGAVIFILIQGAGRLTHDDPTTAHYTTVHPQTVEN